MERQGRLEKFENYYYNEVGMCGCGNPEEIKNLLYKLLKNHKAGKDDEITFKEREANKAEIIKNTDPDAVSDFIFHILDKAGIMEHGGYIGNGWFTEEGEEFIKLLEEFKDCE